jgi:hypothetical protein
VSRTAPARSPVVLFYVSGHGFGHASRVIEVVNALGRLAPDARILIRTSAAPWLFDVTLRVPAPLLPGQVDTGVIQADSLHIDEPATIDAARLFYSEFHRRAEADAALIREYGVTLVISDMPPLAFEAAARAGVPAVGFGNFTWDWIYGGYAGFASDAPWVIPIIRQAYGHAAHALRLPMWGGFEGWPCPVEDVPFVARHSVRPVGEIRSAIGVPADTRMVLASFGGLGITNLALEPLSRLRGYTVVTTAHAMELVGPRPAGVKVLADDAVYRAGLRYEDLVKAADVVVTKPGYGIIAECVANETAILYTSRGHFVEYPVLVEAMPRVLRARFVGHDDLYAGRWGEHLDALLAQPAPPERPRTDGARVVARRILEVLNQGSGIGDRGSEVPRDSRCSDP